MPLDIKTLAINHKYILLLLSVLYAITSALIVVELMCLLVLQLHCDAEVYLIVCQQQNEMYKLMGLNRKLYNCSPI